MNKPTVYLDLDRTLFQTNRVYEIWAYLALRYPGIVDETCETERCKEFYTWNDDLYCHDLSAQLMSLGLTPNDVYTEMLESELADGRFEYPGCRELMHYLASITQPIILTYGTYDYQRFKAKLCPSLRETPIETVTVPKPVWLRDNSATGWLIDDKPIGEEVPPEVRFVQVQHGDVVQESPADWKIVSSLDELREYLQTVF